MEVHFWSEADLTAKLHLQSYGRAGQIMVTGLMSRQQQSPKMMSGLIMKSPAVVQ